MIVWVIIWTDYPQKLKVHHTTQMYSISLLRIAGKYIHIIKTIIVTWFTDHTRVRLQQQNRCNKSFCLLLWIDNKKQKIFTVWYRENQNELASAQEIDPTSYQLFHLILMIAIVLMPFAIISASCNLLRLAWLPACVPSSNTWLL